MLRVKVLIPFHRSATGTDHVPGDEIEVSADELAIIRRLNVNMVLVLGAAAEPKKRSKKA